MYQLKNYQAYLNQISLTSITTTKGIFSGSQRNSLEKMYSLNVIASDITKLELDQHDVIPIKDKYFDNIAGIWL